MALIVLFLSACGGSGNSETTSRDIKAYLIPLYSYPVGSYQSEWERLYQLRTSKRVFVIVNVSNGPGEEKDLNFENAINHLKSKGYKVVGYIATSYGEKDINQVKSEIDSWLEFYGNKIDGFFLDEVSNRLDKYQYYENISRYVRSKDKLIILNPGTNTPLEFFNLADKIVVFENSTSAFFSFIYDDYRRTNPERVCTIVYDVASREEAERIKAKSLENNSQCVYLLQGDSYFVLSQYID
ncbi:spherulation-specific family 4 protein [Thermocrinis sp.]|uniref:spherulation-specific family 4 protein n=1 Tax=Thermocrinis sp. TaxID=2024383 RepID=UPI002FDED4DE